MADETTETTSTSEPAAEPTATEAPAGAATTGAGPEGGAVAGDPSSEPVATAAQSHVAGRVGPPSIQQDAAATWHTGEGVETIEPGAVAPADTVIEGGPVAQSGVDLATLGAGPYGGETPAPQAANVVTQSTPGTDPPGADELPAGTPTASNKSASGGPVTIPATTTSEGSSGSPTSPTEDTSDSSTSTPAGTSDPAGSKPGAS